MGSAKDATRTCGSVLPFCLLSYIFVLTALGSRYFTYAFGTSTVFSRIVTALTYCPFLVFIIVLVASVIRKAIPFSLDIKILAVFAAYFSVLQIYRYSNGVMGNDCLYYTLTLIGTMSLVLLIINGVWTISKRGLARNLLGFAIFVLISIAMYDLFLRGVFADAPVNVNITATLILMLLPVLCIPYRCEGVNMVLRTMVMALAACYVLVCGSRTAFVLLIVVLVGMALINIRKKPELLMIVCATILSVVMTATLCLADIGDSRYALTRELSGFGISISGLFEDHENISPGNDASVSNETQPSEMIPVEAAASSQIERSDNMREDLFNYGIEQIVSNPLFGTGKLTVDYYLPSADDTFRSAPHNFVIETMICYGLVGAIVIVVLFILFIRIMVKTSRRACGQRLYIWGASLAGVVFFSVGSVQPIVYQPITLVLFCLILILYLYNSPDDIEQGNQTVADTGDATP